MLAGSQGKAMAGQLGSWSGSARQMCVAAAQARGCQRQPPDRLLKMFRNQQGLATAVVEYWRRYPARWRLLAPKFHRKRAMNTMKENSVMEARAMFSFDRHEPVLSDQQVAGLLEPKHLNSRNFGGDNYGVNAVSSD